VQAQSLNNKRPGWRLEKENLGDGGEDTKVISLCLSNLPHLRFAAERRDDIDDAPASVLNRRQ
jgi:hypothetical protein